MELTIISLIKIGAVTIIVGQGLKLIDKTEFKKLVDLCGFMSFGLVLAEDLLKFVSNFKVGKSGEILGKIFTWLMKVDEATMLH